MPATELKLLMQKVATGASLTEDETRDAFETMMSGVASPVQMAAFLMALRVRGETIPEITGATRLMRERMLPVEAPPNAVDIVGTGGDGHNTFNVSTAAALVAAGAGVPVAKHGNRSVSSLSGASDVLTALGVKIDVGEIILIGEAPATKRHPQTLHIIFTALEIKGTPKIRPDSTRSLDIAWVPVEKLPKSPLYPDVGKQLYEYLKGGSGRSLEFIRNCMERGFW